MALKFTIQGALIYATLAFFIATFIAALLSRKASVFSRVFWFGGFLAALASLVWRAIASGHAPMQNLFEFFLCMAAVLWPLSFFAKRRSGIDTTVTDAILGVLILFPAGFVFDEGIRLLPPALQSPLFVPHVGSYIAAYVLLARATFLALPLWSAELPENERVRRDAAVREMVAVGFCFLTAGLLLGSVWGQYCWGHFWAWDPKEMASLATWFVYAAYFHVRLRNGLSHPRLSVLLLVTGIVFILFTLTWINISRLFSGMHTYA
ncbi:MAG: cytochrome c biogenesis protein CcsA [Kiritimatiellae bacterium]|nr:cytochrome c biogenesis protein CcsA [Kiritimatiellia bacterium]